MQDIIECSLPLEANRIYTLTQTTLLLRKRPKQSLTGFLPLGFRLKINVNFSSRMSHNLGIVSPFA